MAGHDGKLADLREVRSGVSRALVDIWKGARLIRDGDDITDVHRTRLQALIADLDARIAAHEHTPGPKSGVSASVLPELL